MRNWTRAALLGAGLIGALASAGCASRYYEDDGYSGHRTYYGERYGDRRYQDSYRDTDDSRRVRVCDADGDDCHWEYRRR